MIKYMPNFVASRKVCKTLGIHPNTLRRFANSGKIEYIRTPAGQRIYNLEKFVNSHISLEVTSKINICYCRVSTLKQRNDLERQIEYMRAKYPNYEIVSDIGSSLSYKRTGLLSILERVCEGQIGEVVVAYKDRIGRFGYELIEKFIVLNGGKLVVLDNRAVSKDSELANDLIRIITFYTARYYGSRKYKIQATTEEKIKESTNKEGCDGIKKEESADNKHDKNQENLLKLGLETESVVENLVRCFTAHIQHYDSTSERLSI